MAKQDGEIKGILQRLMNGRTEIFCVFIGINLASEFYLYTPGCKPLERRNTKCDLKTPITSKP